MYDDDEDTTTTQNPFWNSHEAVLALAHGLEDMQRLEQKPRGWDGISYYDEQERGRISQRVADAIRYLYDQGTPVAP